MVADVPFSPSGPALALEHGFKPLPLIALNLNHARLNRAAGAAQLFELFGQCFEGFWALRATALFIRFPGRM